MAVKDTYKYELLQGNKVVYVGITTDPTRREAEHRREKKTFDKMKVVGGVCTADGAQQWKLERIQTYKDNHAGDMPMYNKKEVSTK